MTVLILLFFVFSLIGFYYVRKNAFRDSIIKSFLITFLIFFTTTEILSLFHFITRSSIITVWVISLVVVLGYISINWQILQAQLKYHLQVSKTQHKNRNSRISILCGAAVGLILLISLIIALKSPPNNYDSMTYHMARVSHWIQNQSIRYYPTAIPRQNYSMPLAEFGILHLQLLSNSDQYANLIQWSSLLISIFLVTLLAKETGVSKEGQWLSALITVTIPIAVLQSSSTQNDLVVGAFCLGFAYFMLKSVNDFSYENIFFASLSMGFALATKGTAYVYCAAIGVSIGGINLFGKKWVDFKRITISYIMIITLALLMNSGIYIRNWQLNNHPILPSNEKTINEEFSARIFLSNVVRNGAAHLATPVHGFNQILTNSITNLLGSNIDNPASTSKWSTFKVSYRISEDDSGNFFHFLLLTFSILVTPWKKKDQPQKYKSLLTAVVISTILFCLLFKWQPWGSRLQIPIFLLGTTLIAYLFDRFQKNRLLITSVVILLSLSSLPYLFLNPIRPLLPFWEDDSVFYNTEFKEKLYIWTTEFVHQYPSLEDKLSSFASLFYEGRSVLFTDRRELYFLGNIDYHYDYRQATAVVRDLNPKEVGLLLGTNHWEYPIWVLLDQHASANGINIYHIKVNNNSGKFSNSDNQTPETILATYEAYQEFVEIHGYDVVYSSDSIHVLKGPE